MSIYSKVVNSVYSLLEKKIDGTGLALFRILFSVVLLLELTQMYYFRHLIFDKIPYVEYSEIDFSVPLSIWMLSVICLTFGFHTRIASIINYIFSVTIFGTLSSYEYHIFYVYLMTSFLFMFAPISQCLSIDRYLQKIKYSSARFQYDPPRTVSKIYYYAFLFFAVGFVYLDSTIFKLTADLWKSGLGVWLPSSIPFATFGLNFLNDYEFIVKGMSHVTLVFEFLFLFLFFVKKLRWFFFIVGSCLHLGILFVFPIPWFALAMTSFYVLFIPVGFYDRLISKKKNKKSLFFYYDNECPLCIKTKITITSLDVFNKVSFKTVQFDSINEKALKDISQDDLLDSIYSVDTKGRVRSGVDTYIAVFKRIWILFPLGYLMQLPGVYNVAKKLYSYIAVNRNTDRCTDESCGIMNQETPETKNKVKVLKNLSLLQVKQKGFLFILLFLFIMLLANSFYTLSLKVPFLYGSKVSKACSSLYSPFRSVNKTFFGITQHGVFVDSHFNNYNHNISVWYLDKFGKETVLPIIMENGTPGWYNFGTNWAKWTFRVNSPNINQENLSKGVRDFTAFWAQRNGVELIDAKFIIKVKKVDIPNDWEEGYYDKEAQKPWLDGGYVLWKDKKFTSYIYDVESI
jgi:predicted DCC family thiol-disulfide oxidoreductase YuxK